MPIVKEWTLNPVRNGERGAASGARAVCPSVDFCSLLVDRRVDNAARAEAADWPFVAGQRIDDLVEEVETFGVHRRLGIIVDLWFA